MEYSPLDPEVTRNPYPTYAALRREAPVCRTALGFSAVSRYEDVREVLRHPELFSSSPMGDAIEGVKALSPEQLGRGETLLGSDPPRHTRLRKIVNRAFTPRRMAALQARVRELAGRLVAELPGAGECDLVAGLATPLPVTIIAEILGIDPARHEDFKRWSDEFLEAMAGPPTPALQLSLGRSFLERGEYLREVVEERRRVPRNDVISALVQAQRDEEAMNEDEVLNFVNLLLIAGNETTTNLIGNAVLALIEHVDVMAVVRADLSLVPALLEEVVRYDAPVQLTLRRATRDLELSGEKILEGETLALLLGSANRDERVFDNPDRIDLAREGGAHVSFGLGTHFCLGAHLARLEAHAALEALLAQRRDLALAEGGVERAPSLFTRGPKTLRVSLDRVA